MEIVLSEKQYNSLFENIEKDVHEQETPDPEPKSGASDDQGKSTEGYPNVSTWEDVVGSKISRGPANQIKNTKWSEVVGSQISRGPANQLFEQGFITSPHYGDGSSVANYKALRNFDWKNKELDKLQTYLDWFGLIPIAGDIVDFINGVVYFIRGYKNQEYMLYVNGIISMIAIIPGFGSAVTLPFKKLFKRVASKEMEKVGSMLIKGDGNAAADYLIKHINKTENGRKIIKEIADKIRPYINKTKKYDSLMAELEDYFKYIPGFVKRNIIFRRLIKFTEKLSGSVRPFLKRFLDVADGMTTTSKLDVPSIPSKYVTKSGRLLKKGGTNTLEVMKNFFKKLTLPSKMTHRSEKLFLAMQDMFMKHLFKGGKKLISNDIIKQAFKNLEIKQIAPKTFETIIQENPKVRREITNLVIANNPKAFSNYIDTMDFAKRYTTWMKSISDPTIFRDAMTFIDALRHTGYKAFFASVKQIFETDREIQNRLEKMNMEKSVKTSPVVPPSKTDKPQKKDYLNKTFPERATSKFVYTSKTPIRVGQRNPIVANVQTCFNLEPTGNYDEKLKQTLLKNGYDVKNGMTWDTYKKIRAKCLKNKNK